MPESMHPGNEYFNTWVSRVRIRSENAIGYLKGRFQSLKSLRVNITGERDHKFATYWVLACVVLHNIALEVEAAERVEGEGFDQDPFFERRDDDTLRDARPAPPANTRLDEGRKKRQDLRTALFRAHNVNEFGLPM
jgi:hypothetical protein